LIAPGLAGTVVKALRHIGPGHTADLAQIAAPHLSPNDKKTLASTAVQARAWMRSTLLPIAGPATVGTTFDRWFYVVDGDELLVIACFHSRRDPRRWQSRA
jgi:hypothetical protein